MKVVFLFLSLLFYLFSSAQTFDSSEFLLSKSFTGHMNEFVILDFDNDGDDDVVGISLLLDELFYFENIGGGIFADMLVFNLPSGNTNGYGFSELKVVDINGDGLKDISFNSSAGVFFIFNNTFDVKAPSSTNSSLLINIYGVQVKDFDGDGVDEIIDVLISGYKITINVYTYDSLNNVLINTLSIQSQNNVSSSVNNVPAANMLDVDGDGDQDFIVVHPTNNNMIWFENNNDGTFNNEVTLTNITYLPNVNKNLYIYDMDNDNDEDIIIVKFSDIFFYENIGGGAFNSAIQITTGAQELNHLFFLDSDNNGFIEIMSSTNLTTSYVSKLVFYEYQSGLFNEISSLDLSNYYHLRHAVLVDIDEDGNLDLFTIIDAQALGWFKKNGNFTFEDTFRICNSVSFKSTITRAFDYDNDGDNDVFTISETGYLSYFENLGGNTFGKEKYALISDYPYYKEMLYSDYNNNGYIDIFLLNTSLGQIYVIENDSGNRFIHEYNLGASGVNDFCLSDINNDGYDDLIAITNSSINWIENNTNSSFLNSAWLQNVNNQKVIKAVDADNDGDIDIFTGGYQIGTTSIGSVLYYHENQGNNTFVSYSVFNSGGVVFKDIEVADFNNDGLIDLALISSNELNYFTYLGGGVFSSAIIVNNQMSSNERGYITDFDFDGKLDVIVYSSSNIGEFYIFNNNGNGLDLIDTTIIESGMKDVCFSDLNDDFMVDLVAPFINPKNKTSWYKNNNSCISYKTDTIIACSSYTWIDGVTYVESTDTVSYTFPNGSVNGCDSIVYLDLTIFPSSYNVDYQTACESYTWIDGIEYTNSNTSATYSPYVGCDIQLDLVILDPVIVTDYQLACNSYTWINGVTYTSSTNTPSVIYPGAAANGCDSIVVLDLVINPTINTTTDTVVACDSYTWINGATYTSSTLFNPTFGLTNIYGCDSLVTLDLTILYSSSQVENLNVCSGDSYTFPDGVTVNNITHFYNHSTVLTSINGCDSVINYNVWVDEINFYDTVWVCSGDSYTFSDGFTQVNILSDMDYTVNYIASTGCDSIISTNVRVIDIDTSVFLNFSNPYYMTLESNYLWADTYTWIDCSTNDTIWWNFSDSEVLVDSPGDYMVIINDNNCIDSSMCITVTNQNFYDLPNYEPMFGQVFAFPVTSLGVCDTIAEAYINGGFQPYSFDWYTQVNNEDTDVLDSICEGFHTLKVVDAIGDSLFVDYYVTDTINWFNWIDTANFYVDTIYMAIENCGLDINLPIDSVNVVYINYLYTGSQPNEDYYFLQFDYYQLGNAYSYGDTILMEYDGWYFFNFSVYCPSKATSRIKTILFSFNSNTLNLNEIYSPKTISIYPNPTNTVLNIQLSQNNSNPQLKIVDYSGKLVFSSFLNEKDSQFDLTFLSSGVYFINLIFEDGEIISSKLIVNK